jgi:hypothetical protein
MVMRKAHRFGRTVAVLSKRWLRRELRWIVDGIDWKWAPAIPLLLLAFYGTAFLLGRFD